MQRTGQVASVIRRVVQDRLIRGLHDPRVRGLVSVTEVQVTEDLAEAVIRISVLPVESVPLTLKGLRSAAGHLRSELSHAMSSRRAPRLRFELDDSLKRAASVEAALEQTRHAGGAPADDTADESRESTQSEENVD